MGCHSIRVNSFGKGAKEEVGKAAIDGLSRLATFAKDFEINIIVENHGGWSSDGKWLSNVMQQVNLPNCGTLPDFGNFCIEREGGRQWDGKCINEYDKYQGVQELMPHAKAVSAKSFNFDDAGNCVEIDFYKMLKIVKEANYKGYIGIEYEGTSLDAYTGIRATKALMEKAGRSLG